MGNPLRDRRTPSEWAASGQVIEIAEKIGDFKRLAGIIEADLSTLDPDRMPSRWRDAAVTGTLSFGFADAQQRVPALEGRLDATVDVVCQRCLEPFRLPLEADLHLLFGAGPTDVAGDEGYEGYEVWEMDENRLQPMDLVEEVLIIAMPLAALHVDDSACEGPAIEVEERGSTTRPFASLKAQMEDEH